MEGAIGNSEYVASNLMRPIENFFVVFDELAHSLCASLAKVQKITTFLRRTVRASCC